MLKPQDIVLALALIGRKRRDWDFPTLGDELQMSLSAVHRALHRLRDADVYSESRGMLRAGNTHELLVHAVRYLAPLREGAIAQGVPTGAAAAPLKDLLTAAATTAPDAIWVWPHPEGTARGISVEPLVASCASIALDDPTLYERLAALDALRGGRARERALAGAWFRAQLGLD